MVAWKESAFQSFDQVSLFYRILRPQSHSKKILLYLHRGHEHSGRITSFAESLDISDALHVGFDMRGHGKSAGDRGWAKGFDVWVKDLEYFIRHLESTYQIDRENIVLVANSVGSIIALNWILHYGGRPKACVLGAPAFSIKLYIPFALSALRLLNVFKKKAFVTSYVRSNMLTRNKEHAKSYDQDDLITKKIAVSVLITMFDASRQILNRAKDFDCPMLIFSAEKDFIVKNKDHVDFFNRISSKNKKYILLKGFKHAVFHEEEMEKVTEPVKEFIGQAFFQSAENPPAVIPIERAHTVQEYIELSKENSKWKSAYYYLYRKLLQGMGFLSRGIKIGLRSGFDSGISLDYIYQNKAHGFPVLGKIVDRIYLNAVGWRGIRKRKENLKHVLKHILGKMYVDHKKLHVFDVASGPGRYLFEVAKEIEKPLSLTLMDKDPACVAHANLLKDEFAVGNVTCAQWDIFDQEISMEACRLAQVVVISGVMELYPENGSIAEFMARLYMHMPEGSHLIYTGQPWHPQLEMIGRALNNNRGRKWLMRRRVQQEMDQLVEVAGFSKVSTDTDDLGIFTVSHAQKVSKNKTKVA